MVNAVFLLLVSTQFPILAGVLAFWIISGYVVYRHRVWKFGKNGIDLRKRMKHLHDHEEERARAGSKQD
ncbi:MAG: amino acid permease-associated protein, partial [Halobacteria archaeon]|nr:amino acid permease-associated protein [Halobacteria archaeon]